MYSLKEEYGAVLTASKLGNFLKSSDKYPHLRLWWAALKARPSSQLIFREALAMLDVMRNKEEFFTELEYEL